MTGDDDDFRARLRLALPLGWFSDTAPLLEAIFLGLAASWTRMYELIQFTIQQSRIKTATDDYLDLAALDYLSSELLRRPLESDTLFRARLLKAMQRVRATKPAIITAGESAGYEVEIFEPAQPANTGAYNIGAKLAWNVAGGWGSFQMPFEVLVQAHPSAKTYESELWQNIADATPAGGAIWLRVLST